MKKILIMMRQMFRWRFRSQSKGRDPKLDHLERQEARTGRQEEELKSLRDTLRIYNRRIDMNKLEKLR